MKAILMLTFLAQRPEEDTLDFPATFSQIAALTEATCLTTAKC